MKILPEKDEFGEYRESGLGVFLWFLALFLFAKSPWGSKYFDPYNTSVNFSL